MPLKTGMLTPSERAFCEAYALTGDRAYSGQKAGYKGAPGISMALARPAVRAEIQRIQSERLVTEGLPLAVDAHMEVLRNARTPAGAKVQAIKLMYDNTLGSSESDNREPHEMSATELSRSLEKLRREASNRAVPIIDHDAASVFD